MSRFHEIQIQLKCADRTVKSANTNLRLHLVFEFDLTRTSLTVLVSVALLASAVATVITPVAGLQEDVTQVDDCTTITEPGRYVLGSDILGGGKDNFTFISQSCLVVESDDVVLEGRGHQVDGTGVTDTTGIAVVGTSNDTVENVTIKNVTLTDWNQGIVAQRADGVSVRNVTLADNAYGMAAEQSTGVSVTRSTVRDNLIGVYEDGGSNVTQLTGTSFDGNYAGDAVSDADNSSRQTVASSEDHSRLSVERTTSRYSHKARY